MKEPPPVACPDGLAVNIPDPVIQTMSPFDAEATAGQPVGNMVLRGGVHRNPVPTRYCLLGSLLADTRPAKDRLTRSKPSVSAKIFGACRVFIAGLETFGHLAIPSAYLHTGCVQICSSKNPNSSCSDTRGEWGKCRGLGRTLRSLRWNPLFGPACGGLHRARTISLVLTKAGIRLIPWATPIGL